MICGSVFVMIFFPFAHLWYLFLYVVLFCCEINIIHKCIFLFQLTAKDYLMWRKVVSAAHDKYNIAHLPQEMDKLHSKDLNNLYAQEVLKELRKEKKIQKYLLIQFTVWSII